MSLVKITYVDYETVITAENLNEIQDTIGDGSLSGFTATDLTGAANELKTALDSLDANDVSYDPTETFTAGTVGKAIKTAESNILWHDDIADVVGTTKLYIPDNWKELNIMVQIEANTQREFVFQVVRGRIGIGTHALRTGYYVNSGNNAYVSVTLEFASTSSYLQLNTAVLSGVDYLSTSKLLVMYRTKTTI